MLIKDPPKYCSHDDDQPHLGQSPDEHDGNSSRQSTQDGLEHRSFQHSSQEQVNHIKRDE